MGHAVAAAARDAGAEVTLVTTVPASAPTGVTVVGVETADEMAAAVWTAAAEAQVAVLAAAVADYRPADPVGHKLRRADGPPSVNLESTPDILAGVMALERRPLVVGFAAEVGSLDGLVDKARAKGVDLMVGNDVAKEGSGFGTPTNEVVVVDADGATEAWPLLEKTEVARRLVDRVADLLGR
jgi:phosphopantothenoylcysteine decarboxylase/phosphopantothenate--cysteine ligase